MQILICCRNYIGSCNNQQRQTSLNTEIDSVSYALGLTWQNKIALNFKEANDAAFVKGYEDAADTSSAIKVEALDGLLELFPKKTTRGHAESTRYNWNCAVETVLNTTTANLLTEVDSVSYALGLDMAVKMKPILKKLTMLVCARISRISRLRMPYC